ncbi:ADP-ribosylation factor-like protein 13B [Trichoplax sp. H2]|nr:ADP-ribosylation factor-like protein 13B [Trichoplax sp. H2]|eukprot:RDD44571.1 ADP-ribosylation factor-like protein 13B [Trichoplax sp. H2]
MPKTAMTEIFTSCLPCLGRSNGSNKKSEITLLTVGLDGAGKSTILRCLQGESIEGVSTTVGFNNFSLQLYGRKIITYDVGGGPRIRGIWKNYYHDVHGIIYVVDASDHNKLEENLEVLEEVVKHDKSKGKPILVLANKQDIPNAIDKERLVKQLQLHSLLTNNQNPYRVEGCIAHKGTGSKTDKSIKIGFKWLIDTIGKSDALMKRVAKDIANQKEIDDRENKERRARARARREKEERESQNRDQVDVTQSGDPFKRVVVTGNEMYIGDDKIEGKKGKKSKKSNRVSADPESPSNDRHINSHRFRNNSDDDDDEDDDLVITGNSSKNIRNNNINVQPPRGATNRKEKADYSDSDSDDDTIAVGKSYHTRQEVTTKKAKSSIRRSYGGSESSDEEVDSDVHINNNRSHKKIEERKVDRERLTGDRLNKLTRSDEIDEDDDDDGIVTTRKHISSKHRHDNNDGIARDNQVNIKKNGKNRNKQKKKGKGNKIAPIGSDLYQDETHSMLSEGNPWNKSVDSALSDSRPRRLKPLDLSGGNKSRAFRGQPTNTNTSVGDEMDLTSNWRTKPNAEEDDIVM